MSARARAADAGVVGHLLSDGAVAARVERKDVEVGREHAVRDVRLDLMKYLREVLAVHAADVEELDYTHLRVPGAGPKSRTNLLTSGTGDLWYSSKASLTDCCCSPGSPFKNSASASPYLLSLA